MKLLTKNILKIVLKTTIKIRLIQKDEKIKF